MNNEPDGVDELDKLYKSGLWKEIEDNFREFDELIEDDDLRDFYKRVIWELVNCRIASAQSTIEALKSDLEKETKLREMYQHMTERDSQDIVSLGGNVDTMADNVDLAVKERDRYKDALEEKSEKGNKWISGYLITEIANLCYEMNNASHSFEISDLKEILDKYDTKLYW